MIPRREVYKNINQHYNPGEYTWMKFEQPVSCWLIQIKGLYEEIVYNTEPAYMLSKIWELAGLCIACMESQGIVNRHCPNVHYDVDNIEDVYKCIDEERHYQDNLGPDRTNVTFHPIQGYLCMFDHYLRRAIDEWTLNSGDIPALNQVRKLAAITINCLEKHGEYDATANC